MARIGLTGILAGILAGPLTLSSAVAQDVNSAPAVRLDAAFANELRALVDVPLTHMAIGIQNARHAALSQADIDALDTQWRAEREADDKPLIAATLMSPLSLHLLKVQAASLGLFTEIFVMDAHGLNVGQSAVTSDYWQGDEAKFQKTYPVGPEAVFVDEAEYHEASGTWRAQVNLTVAAEDDAPIGAATIEVNLTELARREALTN